MAKITEYAMAMAARKVANPDDKATAYTPKLFAEVGETAITPTSAEENAWALYKALSAWFTAREEAGVNEDTEDNSAILSAYAKAARHAASEWFKMHATKPGKKDGDNARPFVALNHAEMGILGEICEAARKAAGGIDDTAKLSKKFMQFLIVETARLLDGKPYTRLTEADLAATKKAANEAKKAKASQTRRENTDKAAKEDADKQEQAQALANAEQAQADAEKKLADATALIADAITLVEQSHATEIEKASIIGKLKAAMGQ